jgi:DNA ligase-associated metallophosphoesterase
MTGPRIPGSHPILWRGERLELLSDGALHWTARNTLVVSDLHFGKTMAFQSRGVAVPTGHPTEALDRISVLAERLSATRLLLLGDFVHDPHALSEGAVGLLRAWRQGFAGEVMIVAGNHDRIGENENARWGLSWVRDDLPEPPFLFSHAPSDGRGGNICGHVHPCLRMTGGPDSLRLRCFVVEPAGHAAPPGDSREWEPQVLSPSSRLILPAFGEFTGCRTYHRGGGRRFYVLAEERVVPVG